MSSLELLLAAIPEHNSKGLAGTLPQVYLLIVPMRTWVSAGGQFSIKQEGLW